MNIARRVLLTLALVASLSVSASAFNPGAFVKNAAGNALGGKRKQMTFPNAE